MSGKKALSLCLAATLAGIAARSAQATVIAYEPFGYTAGAGALANQTGGGSSGFSGAWDAGVNSVTNPGLTYAKGGVTLDHSGNTATTVGTDKGNFRILPAATSTGTVYVSFLANFTGGTGGSAYGGVSLFNGASGENLFIGAPSGAATWGVDQSTGTVHSTVAEDTTVHLFVVQVIFGGASGGVNDHVNMYIDPSPGKLVPDVAAAVSVDTTRPDTFDRIRVQSGGNEIFNFDEIRITTTYAESVIPEPASLGLLGLGGLGLLARRRRA